MRRDQLELFKNRLSNIILSNGFSYTGFIKEISNESITFEDRFSGIMLIDINSIRMISEKRMKNDN